MKPITKPEVTPRQRAMVQDIIDSLYEPYEYDEEGNTGINIPLPRKIRKQIERANKKARKKRNNSK